MYICCILVHMNFPLPPVTRNTTCFCGEDFGIGRWRTKAPTGGHASETIKIWECFGFTKAFWCFNLKRMMMNHSRGTNLCMLFWYCIYVFSVSKWWLDLWVWNWVKFTSPSPSATIHSWSNPHNIWVFCIMDLSANLVFHGRFTQEMGWSLFKTAPILVFFVFFCFFDFLSTNRQSCSILSPTLCSNQPFWQIRFNGQRES